MRYFFHIVDKYGLSADRTGSEHADRDAAILHAERIAAELAKAGEFFGPSFVLVGGTAVHQSDAPSQPVPKTVRPQAGVPISYPSSLQRNPDLRS